MASTFETFKDITGSSGQRTSANYITTSSPRYTWRPETWDQTLMMINPNGTSRVTALLGMAGKQKLDDNRFHWLEQRMPDDYAAFTAISRHSSFTASSAYAPATAGSKQGGNLASVLYLKMTAANSDKFVVGMIIRCCDASHPRNTCRMKVTAVTRSGANSYLTCTLLEVDDNGSGLTGSLHINDSDAVAIIGSAHEEGAEPPVSIMFDGVWNQNTTQIFRTSLKHTRTAMQTRLRGPEQVAKAKREALLMHGARKEKAFFHGIYSITNVGANGYPQNLTGGLDYFLTSNVTDFHTDKSSTTWANSGWTWMNAFFNTLTRYKGETMSGNRRLGLCGQDAFVAINSLIMTGSEISTRMVSTQAMTNKWGQEFTRMVFPTMTLDLAIHPLLTYNATTRASMYVIDPSLITVMALQDTVYRPKVGTNGMDGEMSEFLDETGFKVEGEELMGIMHNFGNA